MSEFMDKQEFFNKVVTHLLKQNKKSGVPGQCKYRTEMDGEVLRCAIGACIPDDIYDERMEDRGIAEIMAEFPEVRPYLSDDVRFMIQLQQIHDRSYPKYWRLHLRFVARDYGLEMPRTNG